MGIRGRPSAADLNVIRLDPQQRPAPPESFTKAQAQTWREIVADMPSDWFQRAPELLEAYCRHVSTANVLAAQINAFQPAWLANEEGLRRYNKLLGMAVRESAALSSLAVKMRLTAQSRWSAKTAATAVNRTSGSRPWDVSA